MPLRCTHSGTLYYSHSIFNHITTLTPISSLQITASVLFIYSKTCVRQTPLKLTSVVDVKRWLSYKGTCHVILQAKLHDMYLYKTDNFFHINHYLKSVSKVALLHRFYCTSLYYIVGTFKKKTREKKNKHKNIT